MQRNKLPIAFEWYKIFGEGHESIEHDSHLRRPKTSTDEKHVKQIKEFVLENRRLIVCELVNCNVYF